MKHTSTFLQGLSFIVCFFIPKSYLQFVFCFVFFGGGGGWLVCPLNSEDTGALT